MYKSLRVLIARNWPGLEILMQSTLICWPRNQLPFTGGKRRDRIQVFVDQFYKDRGVWRFLEISRACLLLISCREAVCNWGCGTGLVVFWVIAILVYVTD